MAKKIYIDTETTGRYPNKHGLINLAGIITIDDVVQDSFNYYIHPFDEDEIDEDAMQVHGIDLSKERAQRPELVWYQFKKKMEKHVNQYNKTDKFHFYAYSARFDYDFLRAWWRKCDAADDGKYFGSWFWTPPIDIMSKAAEFLIEKRKHMPDFKQLTVAGRLGIDVSNIQAHRAMADVQLAKMIDDLVTGREVSNAAPTKENSLFAEQDG